MQETCRKYRVCMSALVDILINHLSAFNLLIPNGIDKSYLDNGKKSQTTIILKQENLEFLQAYRTESYSLILSNLCWLYYNMDRLNEYIKDYPKDKINLIKTKIGNDLAKKKDIYWDYNRIYRNNYRFRKQYEREQENKKANL